MPDYLHILNWYAVESKLLYLKRIMKLFEKEKRIEYSISLNSCCILLKIINHVLLFSFLQLLLYANEIS